MKLSMTMIAGRLARYQPETHIERDGLTITGIRFLADVRNAYSLEYVYLSAADGYFQDPLLSDAFLLVSGANQILCKGADHEELLNDVLASFDFYNRIEQRMYAASLEHAPLSRFVEILGELFGGILLLYAMDGSLLAYAKPEILSVPNLPAIGVDSGIAAHDLGNVYVDAQGRMQHDLTDEPRVYYRADGNTADDGCVCMYLKQDGERIGFLMYFPMSRMDETIAMQFFSVFGTHLAQAQEFASSMSVHQSNRAIFKRLLEGETLPLEVADKFKAQVGLSGLLSLILLESLAIRNHTLNTLLMKELEERMPVALCETEGNVVLLIREHQTEDVLGELAKRIVGSHTRIGISMPLQNLGDLPLALSQAHFAMDTLAGAGISYCRDLALSYQLNILRSHPMAISLLHPAVRILSDYDDIHAGSLLQTLEEYIRCGCSQSQTARNLHIHLNTFKYRLARIFELADIHPEDQDEMFHLSLSVRLQASGGEKRLSK